MGRAADTDSYAFSVLQAEDKGSILGIILFLLTMKKLFNLMIGCGLALMATACSSTTPIAATSNPVGNKCGVAKTTRILGAFGGSTDCGINTAAKKGGITRISHIDSFSKSYLGIVTVYGIRVYGE